MSADTTKDNSRNVKENEERSESGSSSASDDYDETDSRSSPSQKKPAHDVDSKPSLNGVNAKFSGNSLTIESTATRSNSSCDDAPLRLLVVSSKIKNSSVMQSAVLQNVVFFQFKYESSTVESCLAGVSQQLNGRKVESVAFIVHCSQSSIHLTGKDERVLNKDVLAERQPNEAVRDFFRLLINNHMKPRETGSQRIDILACNTLQADEADVIAKLLQTVTVIPVYIHKDILGAEIRHDATSEQAKPICVGDLYFRTDKVRMWSGRNQSLSGFEKIHTVGKGAYGTAVLYKKKDDDSLVILKEINLHDLNVAERQLAQNEICVLAMLDHPNIIGYYDSFEEDGILMIEMEYADGGTLAQYLAQRDKPLEEKEILEIFYQVAQAIKHIHQHNILHRDLKTANIFLTKEGFVKLGDFGISKLMTTGNGGANTVLGTPYYISPEMCEGRPYNDKSDIWALGCILYEMACLQKTFEGSNLPALVNKIMKGQFAPVKGNYSEEFKTLIMDMLQQDPETRPSASDLCTTRLPQLVFINWSGNLSFFTIVVLTLRGVSVLLFLSQLMLCYERSSFRDGVDDDHSKRRVKSQPKSQKSRSVLYYFRMSDLVLVPIELPSKVKLDHVSIGNDHVIVVTSERMVYSWGDGSKGQLGHGNLDSKSKPCLIDALKGKSVLKAYCGDGFTVFGSDNGLVLTCGDGSTGCLGHGDWNSVSKPKLIETLLSVDVTSLTAGPLHVLAVGSQGDVYTWGQGSHGCLGLGTDDDHCHPMEVVLPERDVIVRDCRAGYDGSVLITDVGSIFACGSNEHNKLGLNQRQGFLMAMKNMFNKCEVGEMRTFTVVRALARHRVLDVSLGRHHTCVLVDPGHVYTLGRNMEAQLGNGNNKPQPGPIGVRIFEQRPATRVTTGNLFTVAATTHGELLFWGQRSTVTSYGSTLLIGSGDEDSSRASVRSPNDLHLEQQTNGEVSSDSANSKSSNAPANSFKPEGSGGASSKDDVQIIPLPMPLLRFEQPDAGNGPDAAALTVSLLNFFTHGDNIFLQVETTAPPPRKSFKRKKKLTARRRADEHASQENKNLSVSSHDGGDEYSSEASELDSTKNVPPWLQQEFKHCWAGSEADRSDGNEADCTTEHSDTDDLSQSTTSIIINKDFLKHAKVSKSASIQLPQNKLPHEIHKPAHNTDLSLSSSGSNEVIPVVTRPAPAAVPTVAAEAGAPKKIQQPVVVVAKRPVVVSAVKTTLKPSTAAKTRSHSRKRVDAAGSRNGIADDIKNKQHGLSVLQIEMENLRLEKRKTEEKLKRMEIAQQKQKEKIALEAAKQSAEKEQILVREVSNLRQELEEQSSQLKNNQQIILALQEQLSRVQQQEQDALRKSPVSRLCAVQ